MSISLSEARALYDGGAPVAHVAKALGLKADAFRRLRRKHGWPMRPSPIVSRVRGKALAQTTDSELAGSLAASTDARPEDAGAPEEEGVAKVDIPTFRRQVADAAQRQLSKVQKRLSSGRTEDVERNARILASLVKSLAELRRLEALDPLAAADAPALEGQDDERPPRDLETLRDELARALERMSGERESQGDRG